MTQHEEQPEMLVTSGTPVPITRAEGYWISVRRQFLRRKLAVFSLLILLILGLTAIFANLLANNVPIIMKMDDGLYFPVLIDHPELRHLTYTQMHEQFGERIQWMLLPPVKFSPTELDIYHTYMPPNDIHLLGTDDRGRDVLSRLIYGSRVSLSVGFVAVSIYVVIGVILGALAGYFGGLVDVLISRFTEVMMCIPTLIFIIAVIAFLSPSIYNVMIVIGLFGWTGVARLVRAEFLKLKSQEYATAAEALGAGNLRIIFRHLLPNSLAPVFVSATFGIAGAIILESALSYLGFGVPPPTASWGDTLSLSRSSITYAWWIAVFPGAAIFVTVVCFNLVGEALRDALDPRLRM